MVISNSADSENSKEENNVLRLKKIGQATRFMVDIGDTVDSTNFAKETIKFAILREVDVSARGRRLSARSTSRSWKSNF